MDKSGFQRMTTQRRVILEELRAVRTHPTADELYERVRKRVPRISLGTVYRNLDLLTKCGMIQKLEAGGAQARYDGDMGDHYHVRCADCGRVDDIPEEAWRGLEPPPAALSGYTIIAHRVELLGICPACQRRTEQRKGEADGQPEGDTDGT